MKNFKQISDVELQMIEGGRVPNADDVIKLLNKGSDLICSFYQGFVGSKYKNGC